MRNTIQFSSSCTGQSALVENHLPVSASGAMHLLFPVVKSVLAVKLPRYDFWGGIEHISKIC
jgi:hypothetical protein